jgi:hypothetical protein
MVYGSSITKKAKLQYCNTAFATNNYKLFLAYGYAMMPA